MENTYNEWADYYGNAGMMNAQRLQDERTYNLLSKMFENYRLNSDGEVVYNGSGTSFAINPMHMISHEQQAAARGLRPSEKRETGRKAK